MHEFTRTGDRITAKMGANMFRGVGDYRVDEANELFGSRQDGVQHGDPAAIRPGNILQW